MKRMILMFAAALALWLPAGFARAADAPDAEQPGAGQLAMATFAGGCFWCMEARFEQVPGVTAVYAGYTGGEEANPDYDRVAGGRTGHVEAIRVYYKPDIITFEGLLQVYFRIADPTDAGGQFVDRGPQYRPVIFFHDEQQRLAAMRELAELRRSQRYSKPVIVPVEPARTFWLAEPRHQDFYVTHDVKFRNFRYSNPRGVFQKRIWGDELNIDYSRYRPDDIEG